MQTDLISRSAAINVLQELADMETCGNVMSDVGFGLSMAIGRLISAPAVDAVPVVRCRDCTWFNHGYCMSFNDDVMPDGFCSRGHTET